MSHFLRAAQPYVCQRIAILPCREADCGNGKAKAPYNVGGFNMASAEEAQLRQWSHRYPRAAIGLPCRANGIVVIDADRHGHGDGVAAIRSLFEQAGFDAGVVPCVHTPRDGRHYYFRRPAGLGDTKNVVATAVDVRDNAYVIAAGSVMADGGRYMLQGNWSVDSLASAIAAGTLLELPSWLAELIAKPVVERSPLIVCGDPTRRLVGLVRTVVVAPKGRRNNTLYWAACVVGEMAFDGLISVQAALALLAEAGWSAGLTISEARATADSGFRFGLDLSGRG